MQHWLKALKEVSSARQPPASKEREKTEGETVYGPNKKRLMRGECRERGKWEAQTLNIFNLLGKCVLEKCETTRNSDEMRSLLACWWRKRDKCKERLEGTTWGWISQIELLVAAKLIYKGNLTSPWFKLWWGVNQVCRCRVVHLLQTYCRGCIKIRTFKHSALQNKFTMNVWTVPLNVTEQLLSNWN